MLEKRLAVYGLVDSAAGSVASANALLIGALADRGWKIDLFGIDGFTKPGDLTNHQNIDYQAVSDNWCGRVWKRIENVGNTKARGLLSRLFSMWSGRVYERRIGERVRACHRREPYAAFLALGLLAPFRLQGALTVSWGQGTPNGEGSWFVKRFITMIRYGGLPVMILLLIRYAVRIPMTWLRVKKTDLILCCSEWEKSQWRQLGVPAKRIAALPYPFDLAMFERKMPPAPHPGGTRFLHLGRLVPRKRLDLLLKAFQLYRRGEPEATLEIIGRFAYAPRYRRLLEDQVLMANVTYRESVPRAEVPALLERCDVVLQPSEHENFGSSVAEAMAAGVPVVIGPTNGTKDYLDSASVVFPVYTPESVAEAMKTAAARNRTDAAKSALAAARAHFPPARVAESLLEALFPASHSGRTDRR